LLDRFNTTDAHAWYRNEVQQVPEIASRKILTEVVESLDVFIK